MTQRIVQRNVESNDVCKDKHHCVKKYKVCGNEHDYKRSARWIKNIDQEYREIEEWE